MAYYGNPSYWDERYTKDPEPFDWYQKYSGVKDIINQNIKEHDRILMTGCGNSRLTEEMYDDGFKSIVNVDISETVINAMREKYKDYKGLEWKLGDVMSMDEPDACYDAIVDKATLDSLLCGENSTANVAKYLSEASRVLKPEGSMIIITYGTPENRLSYLEQDEYKWNVSVHTVAKPDVSAAAVTDTGDGSGVHYIYVCRKKQ